MRFGPKNRILSTTETTGTGSYVYGNAVVGRQSFSELSDGTTVPYFCAYGTQWECGIGTKQGSLLLRTRVLESTNGNALVDWGKGKKDLGVDWLANNVVYSPDGSITVEDEVSSGKTAIRGLKLSDVTTWLGTGLAAGRDIKISQNPTTKALTIDNAASIFHDSGRPSAGQPGPFDLNFDLSLNSIHVVEIEVPRRLHFVNTVQGQEYLVRLNYGTWDGHDPSIIWPNSPECSILWARGYEPALNLRVGQSDTFKVLRIADVAITVDGALRNIPQFLIWHLSTQHRLILEGTAVCDVLGQVSTVRQGVNKGPNEIQWLSAEIDCDRMIYTLKRSGSVTGGTFDLSIGTSPTQNEIVEDIPYDVTATELLGLIWEQTDLTEFQINVHGGLDGSLCSRKLTDSEAEIQLEFIGKSRYLGWVVSVDGSNLTGSGSYDVDAVDEGSGSAVWPFDVVDPDSYSGRVMKFEFNGQKTGAVAVNSPLGAIQQALEGLAGIGAGNIIVRSSAIGVFTFEFVGDLRSTDIQSNIKFSDDDLPSSSVGTATSQVFSTTRNGAGPQGTNEIQRLRILGNPVNGDIKLTIQSQEIFIAYNATASAIQTAINAALGFGSVIVTGGPLPTNAMDIEYSGNYSYRDLDEFVVDTTETGAVVIDWTLCDGVDITLAPGDGTYHIKHKNPIRAKTINVNLFSNDAAGIISWDGISVDWGGIQSPEIPEDGNSTLLEFYAFSITDIKGKKWFGGSGTADLDDEDFDDFLQSHLNPGIGIEIEHDEALNLFTIHRLETVKIESQSNSITLDVSANVGEHHEVVLSGNTSLAIANEKDGQKVRVLVRQAGSGGNQVIWWQGIVWARGIEPPLNPVVGGSSLFEFLVRKSHAPYVVGDYLGWEETPDLPKFADLSGSAFTVDEIQQIHCNGTPVSGSWIISYDGNSTSPIAYNATATQIQTALRALPSIGSSGVVVSGGVLGVSPIVVRFQSNLSARNVPLLQVVSNLGF